MARGDIRNRITLEGDEDVRRRLEALGRAGEQAVQQIGDAATGSNASLARLSEVSARFQNTFKTASVTLRDSAASFQVLGQRGREFGAQLAEVADRVVPHFREVMALATAGSVVGFIALAKSSADAAQRIGDGARSLNISVQSYQDLGQAAARTGTSLETATGLFARLARNISEAAKEQADAIGDITKELFGDLATNGVTVISSVGKAGTKATSQVVSDIANLQKLITQLAPRVQSALAEMGISKTAQEIVNRFIDIGSSSDAAGVKLRAFAQHAGAVGVTGKTVAEAIDLMKLSTDSTAATFARMGVQITDVKGKMLPLDQVLRILAENVDKFRGKVSSVADTAKIAGRGFVELIPILDQIREQTSALGLSLTKLDTEMSEKLIGSLAVLQFSLRNIGVVLTNAFAPSIIAIVDAITAAITNNATAFREWSTQLGGTVKPIADDIARAISNIGKAEEDQLPIQTAFVQSMLKTFTAIGEMFSILKIGLQDILAVINVVLAPINALFGTQLTAGVVLATLAILQFLGAFKLLGAGIALADAAISLFVTGRLVNLIELLGASGLLGVIGPAGALALAIGAIIIIFTDWGKAIDGVAATYRGLNSLIGALGDLLGPLGTNLRVISDLMKGDFTAAINTVKDAVINLFPPLSVAIKLFEKLRSLMGGGAPVATAPIPPPTDPTLGLGGDFASGGLVRGPGTATSDSILARLSAGEFVVNAFATARLLPLLEAINGGMNIMPRRTRFATGGLVTATAGSSDGSSVHFHLGGKSFKLWTDRDIRDALAREARRSKLLSAGPAPSAVG